jgi:hypothetical protein
MASCTDGDEVNEGATPNRELKADETKQWNELYAFFDDYENNKRILPLNMAVGEGAVTYKKAQQRCDDLAESLNGKLEAQGSSARVVYRLPKREEVQWLAPAVSHGNVSWTDGDIPHGIWYQPTGGSQPCGADNYPYFQNEPTANASSFGCSVNDYWDDDLVTLCVPAAGPMPLLPPQ